MKKLLFYSALDTALAQYQELMGKPFPIKPTMDVIEHEGFWALAEIHSHEFHIRISAGVASTLRHLWSDAFKDKTFLNDVGHPIDADQEGLTHLSLVWLILHEMQHYDLGHFTFTGRHYLAETDQASIFALVSRAPSKLKWSHDIDANDKPKIEPCLELQADHDAIELLLDAYSRDEWPTLRHRALAISAIMMLVEREDANRGDKLSSHPKAATRIFQLLGHVIEMPLIPAQINANQNGLDAINPEDLPSDAEQAVFNRQVTIPCFFDAVYLAKIGGAESIRQDLGEVADFFSDVQIAKSMSVDHFADLKTAGAMQWAELVEFSAILLSKQGLG